MRSRSSNMNIVYSRTPSSGLTATQLMYETTLYDGLLYKFVSHIHNVILSTTFTNLLLAWWASFLWSAGVKDTRASTSSTLLLVRAPS